MVYPKLSLILMCWNTAHLLGRTLETLKNQNFAEEWELLIIDDFSEDDVPLVLEQHGQGLPIEYHRLEHKMGMRGNTFALNYGLQKAIGEGVMWSTPEVMLPPGALEGVCSTLCLRRDDLLWVTIPSHGISIDIQLCIDEVDWKSDIHAIETLVNDLEPSDSVSIWFYLNFFEDGRWDGYRKKTFGNNQTVGVLRKRWLETIGRFPYFLDYGSDDPWVASIRKANGYTDVTLWEHEAYHQWHAPIGYWIALGKAPNWNKFGHTTSNLLDDPEVPFGGTCIVWDGGSRVQMTSKEIEAALSLREFVYATGFRERDKR